MHNRKLLVLISVAFVCAAVAQAETALPAASDCLECHDVDLAAFSESVHGPNGCTSCHSGITDLEKHAMGGQMPAEPDCAGCHAAIGEEFSANVHKHDFDMACADCHARIHSQKSWDGSKKAVIDKCSECHDASTYVHSGHGAAVIAGNQDAAACADCHGLHDTHRLRYETSDQAGRVQSHFSRVCRECHGDEEMMARNGLSTYEVRTYDHTYHGKVKHLGFQTQVAGCADCHAYHNILPPTDPDSTINPDNLVQTCGRCHPAANANFVKFQPHADYTNRDKYPVLYWTFMFMTVLLVATFVFFWTHTILWWRKSYWDRRHLCDEGEVVDPRLIDIPGPAQCYWRFNLLARAMHIVLLTSFFALVLTGMPLRFTDANWAPALMGVFGGAHTAGIVHRVAAVVLVFLFTGTIVMSIRFLLNKKNGATFTARLFSPDSLFPRKKDWEDFKGMVLWFFDRGPEPEFDRWTYWEKFDFLAVFWGMIAIGLSGLLLWLPEATSQVLPGWLFNVAIIVHSDEALLATGFIFTVHFFNTHLIPTKFPMDYVIFTGRIRKWQFIREKPLYWKRLEREGRLDRKRATQPPVYVMLTSGLIGFTALLVGLGIMVLAIGEVFF